MHTKRFFFLLAFIAGGVVCKNANAQKGKDTLFTFYFNTNAHQLDRIQQKQLETLLQKVQQIKTITGYTDTTGTRAHNKVLAQLRALEVFNRLDKTLQHGVEVTGAGETTTAI